LLALGLRATFVVSFAIQLSMIGGGHARPKNLPVELIGIEPTTSGLQSQRSPN
jgi:hypothetical protein